MNVHELIHCWREGAPPVIRIEHLKSGIAVDGAGLWASNRVAAIRFAGCVPSFVVLESCPPALAESIRCDCRERGWPVYNAPDCANLVLREAAKRRLPCETAGLRYSRPFQRIYDYRKEAERLLPADTHSCLRALVLQTV